MHLPKPSLAPAAAAAVGPLPVDAAAGLRLHLALTAPAAAGSAARLADDDRRGPGALRGAVTEAELLSAPVSASLHPALRRTLPGTQPAD